jgi:hypothetical protein
VIELPEPQRKRQIIYDVFANAAQMAPALGLPGISPDVDEMERRASNERVKAVEDIQVAMHDHANFLAAVFIRLQRGQYEAEHGEGSTAQVSDDEWESTYNHLRGMLYAGLLSGVTLLVDTQRLAHVTEDSSGRMA